MKILIKANRKQEHIIKSFLTSIGIKFVKDFNPFKMIRSMNFEDVMQSSLISEHKKLVFLDIILKYFNLQIIDGDMDQLEINYISKEDSKTMRANEALDFVTLEKTKEETFKELV